MHALLIKYKIPYHSYAHGPVIIMFIFKVKYVERYVNYDITIRPGRNYAERRTVIMVGEIKVGLRVKLASFRLNHYYSVMFEECLIIWSPHAHGDM